MTSRKDKEKNYPQLRFPGFTDAWEQRKLGEVGKTQSGIGFPDAEQGGTEGVPFYKVSDMNKPGNEHEMVNANNYVNYEQLSRKKWKIIETVPAVIFAKVGAAIMLNRKRLVTSPFLIDNNTMAYVFDGSWNIDFGKTLFETINLPRYAQVGALPSYNGSDIESIEVTLPSKGEQVKLGAFFKSLDDTITLHQRKLDLLKKLKKGYLQKLFPQNGSKFPQLRFAGFADAWEQRKLGDFGSVGMNRRIYKNQTNERGEIPFFKIGTFGKRPNAFISRKLFNEYKAKYPYPNPGDMLISASGSIGRTIEYKGEDAYYQDSNIVWLQHDQRLDNSFLKQFYAVVRWQGLEGSTIKRLYNKNILGTNITIPSVMEQREIGEFLGKLDVTITLHQRKLEKLQELKKGYLQKMFC